jgi:periplasmic protein TonB
MSAATMNLGLSPWASFRRPQLPWSNGADDEKRFQRIAWATLLLALALGIVVPLLPLQKVERLQTQALPPPLAKLLLERPVQPPAPPAPPPTKPEAAVEAPAVKEAPAKPVDQAVDKPKPKPESTPQVKQSAAPPAPPAPITEARNPVEGKPPGEVALDNARRVASGVGLLAMKDQLAAISAAPTAVQIKQDITPGPGVGTGTGPGVGAGTEAGVPLRNMITSNATKGSGGINTAAMSTDTGGGGLAGRATTLVEGTAGGSGGGGPGSRAGSGSGKGNSAGADRTAAAGNTQVQKSGSGKASRSIEDVKLVFERNKGAIYAIYNRALRDDPALQGKVVLELKIAPSGQVDGLRIVSSELKAEELEKKLLARIRSFDFGAKEVETLVVTWPLDFLPS